MHSFYFANPYVTKFVLNETKYFCLLKYNGKYDQCNGCINNTCYAVMADFLLLQNFEPFLILFFKVLRIITYFEILSLITVIFCHFISTIIKLECFSTNF